MLFTSFHCTGIAEVKGLNPVQAWSFSGFLFTTATVASITAMIFFHIILHPAVLVYDFHIFITSILYRIQNNAATMLQRCVALKVVVANRLV